MLLYLGILLFGPSINENRFYSYDSHWPSEGGPVLLSRLACADSADYLRLAEIGYNPGSRLCAFYPLWPWLLGVTGIAGSRVAPLGSTLLAILFWILGLTLLHRWVQHQSNSQTAWGVVLANLLLPSSIFFWLGYTESIFFLLSVVFVCTSESDKWIFSVAASLFLPLTRPVGIFIVSVSFLGLFDKNPEAWKRSLIQLIASLLGFCFYLLLMWLSTGNCWEGFSAQKYYINNPSLSHLLFPGELFSRFVSADGWHNPKGSVLDRLVFILSIALVISVWKSRLKWFFWALPMILVPAFTNWFLSFSRLSVSALPLMLALGHWVQRCGKRMILIILVTSIINQAYLLKKFFSFGWAS